MGKASRKKKERKAAPEVATKLFEAGMCTKCARRPRLAHSVWCSSCHMEGRRRRRARVPRPLPKHELKAQLDVLIEELS